MSLPANPVPLRHRRPQICAQLEASAATREWSPLEVYWDPRYKKYFYAGATNPATDHHAPPACEFEMGIDQHDQQTRSIIAAPRSGQKRKRRRTISWTMDSMSTTSLSSVADDTRRSGSFWTMCILVMLVIVLLLVLALFILWIGGYLDDNAAGVRNNAATNSAIRRRKTANGILKEADKKITEEPSDEEVRLVLNFVPAAGKPSKVARQRHGTTELPGSICLYTHQDEPTDSFEITGEKIVSSGSERCDVLIRCCYVLEGDMTIRSEISRTGTGNWKSSNHDEATGQPDVSEHQSATALVAIRERGSAFQKLLAAGSQRARDDFVRNALLLARSDGYVGLRLWCRELHGSSIVAHGFVRAVRHLAVALRKANCTLGFFVPYPAAHAQPTRYAARLRVLEKILDSTASLLLYPTTSVLGNGSKWPSPSRMMGVGEKSSGFTKTSSGRSLCHLLLPMTTVSVVLANASESCDVSAIQRVLPKPSFLSHARLSKLCRSWHSSWKVSRHRYYSYACGFGRGGKRGIVFQTPKQALRYRRGLLARMQSTCFGFMGRKRALPHDCQKSPLLVNSRR